MSSRRAEDRAKVIDLNARIFESRCLKTLTSPVNDSERLKNTLNNLRRMKSILLHSDRIFTASNQQESVSKASIARLDWQISEAEEVLARITRD